MPSPRRALDGWQGKEVVSCSWAPNVIESPGAEGFRTRPLHPDHLLDSGSLAEVHGVRDHTGERCSLRDRLTSRAQLPTLVSSENGEIEKFGRTWALARSIADIPVCC